MSSLRKNPEFLDESKCRSLGGWILRVKSHQEFRFATKLPYKEDILDSEKVGLESFLLTLSILTLNGI